QPRMLPDAAVQEHDDRWRDNMGRPRRLLRRLVLFDRCPGDSAMPGLRPSGAEPPYGVEVLGGWRALFGFAVGVDRVDAVFLRDIKVIPFGEDPARHGDNFLRVAGYRHYGHRWSALHRRFHWAAEPGVFE